MKHICINAFALVVYLTMSNYSILSLEILNRETPEHDYSASLCHECMAEDLEGRAMVMELYGIPVLTKDQQDEKTKQQFQQEERRSKAYIYLKKNKIGNITPEHVDIVAYLQDDVQITRPTSEEILNYMYLSGAYLPIISTMTNTSE